MRVRRQARIVVIQTLFEADIANHDLHRVLDQRLQETALPESGVAFVQELASGVWKHRASLDEIIVQIAPEWPVEQLAAIDRNILRMAIYEILATNDTPVKVVVNEAVELAKLFGSDSAPRFVNGVLGTLLRERGRFHLSPSLESA